MFTLLSTSLGRSSLFPYSCLRSFWNGFNTAQHSIQLLAVPPTFSNFQKSACLFKGSLPNSISQQKLMNKWRETSHTLRLRLVFFFFLHLCQLQVMSKGPDSLSFCPRLLDKTIKLFSKPVEEAE
mmetsp:Transcript_2012/g.3775  ORF Transcript_2012/g.3775 Transcript_2012/m.3775 type:complete len:125 (+) Transcript_2012:997-1371(+)